MDEGDDLSSHRLLTYTESQVVRWVAEPKDCRPKRLDLSVGEVGRTRRI